VPTAAIAFNPQRPGTLADAARRGLRLSAAALIASKRLQAFAIYQTNGRVVYRYGAGPSALTAQQLRGALLGVPAAAVVGNAVEVVLMLTPAGPPVPAVGSSISNAHVGRVGAAVAPTGLIVEELLPKSSLTPATALGSWWVIAGILLALSLAGGSLFVLRRELRAHAYEATHDVLTGLANRALLFSRDDLVADRNAALLLLDLDEFKQVNDTFGHATGDELLVQVSTALTTRVRPNDLLIRLGGDEFAALLPGLDEPEAMAAAQRLLGAVRAPVLINGMSIESNASIGISLSPRHGTSIEELLRHADIAMYEAKRSGAGIAVANAIQPVTGRTSGQ
jgi:diguanylate cyclase (GGDEF)-like protein